MGHVYGALFVAVLVVRKVFDESVSVGEPRWLAGCMEFAWVHADSFLHSMASPCHSFVTTISSNNTSRHCTLTVLASFVNINQPVDVLHLCTA